MHNMNKMTDDVHKRFFIERARAVLVNDLNTDADKLRNLDEIMLLARSAEEIHDTALVDALLLDAFNLSNELLNVYDSTGKCNFSVYMPEAERVVDEAYDAYHAIDSDPSAKAVMEYITEHYLHVKRNETVDDPDKYAIQAMFYGYVVCRTHLMKEQALAMEQAQATMEKMLGGLGGKVLGLGMNLGGLKDMLGLGDKKDEEP